MGYEIRAQHAIPEELLRIWKADLHFAVKELSRTRQVESGIHQARKALKRTRALVRLVRDPLGYEQYKAANICYRDASRKVSELRDLAATQDTLNKILKRYPRKSVSVGVSAASREIAGWQKAARDHMRGQDELRKTAVAELTTGLANLPTWHNPQDDFSWIASSLERVYERGQNALALSLANPDPHVLHDWRKRVKYLWHQLQLLHLCWPEMMNPHTEELHRLSDLLGDDHDLAVIEEFILSNKLMQGRVVGKTALLHAIREYRESLVLLYFPLGKKLYQADPEVFTNQISFYWKVWRQQEPLVFNREA